VPAVSGDSLIPLLRWQTACLSGVRFAASMPGGLLPVLITLAEEQPAISTDTVRGVNHCWALDSGQPADL